MAMREIRHLSGPVWLASAAGRYAWQRRDSPGASGTTRATPYGTPRTGPDRSPETATLSFADSVLWISVLNRERDAHPVRQVTHPGVVEVAS